MKISGIIHKVGKLWAVEIPLMLIHTQGSTRKDAIEMAADAVETIVSKSSFKARAHLVEENRFVIGANDEQALFATILKQQRGAHHLSIRDVAARLGSRSPTAYARYESGKTALSIEKFTELLMAIDSSVEPVMTLERRKIS